MAPSVDEGALQALLKSLSAAPATALARPQVALIANALLPSSPRSARATAYLCLSKLTTDLEDKGDSAAISKVLQPYVESIFRGPQPQIQEIEDESEAAEAGGEFDPEACVPATYLFLALYPLSPPTSTTLLTTKLEDNNDPLAVLLELAELPSPLQSALAQLFVAAADSKIGRDLTLSRGIEWLKGGLRYTEGSSEVGALCAAALSKLLGRDAEEKIPVGGEQEEERVTAEKGDQEQLARRMMSHVESGNSSTTAIQSTIEGLAVLSLQPRIRAVLASSQKFLKALVALSPVVNRKGGSLPVTPRGSMDADNFSKIFEAVETSFCYGLASILVNLTSRKPILSEQDAQIAKLRKMAVSADKRKLNEDDDDEGFETDEEVDKRVAAVLAAGVAPALSGLVRAESKLVKEQLGRLCRNLLDRGDSTEKNAEMIRARLAFVKDGGFKALSHVVRDLLEIATTVPKPPPSSAPTPAPPTIEIDILPACQAMAKLIITTNPVVLFPAPMQTTSLNALTPLYHLLIHPDSLLIQRFEALMALTNIASIDPSIAAKLVKAEVKPLKVEAFLRSQPAGPVRVMVKIEEMMLDENVLARRAAVQLLCNIASCQSGFSYLSGEDSSSSPTRARSLLNILLVMACIDDIPTRSAAGGALAVLTESGTACKYILMGDLKDEDGDSTPARSPWSRVISLLEPPSDETYDDDGEPIPIISSSPPAPNPELVHRGVIILYNLLEYALTLGVEEKAKERVRVKEARVEEKLFGALGVVKKMGEEVVQPTVQCLRMIREKL
ncbi:hypothetical protein B9479_003089 [Cryptococcus floricola]|uniref:UNC-45/Cro1/She4 central domain-containing protein n=1 Tax=Cryptococcus floricola TaxID=2591691 RepID=A0A5D3B0I5_9TREE|nr:hypothetical protein B9479_003089 [Cryptococcus floricola]